MCKKYLEKVQSGSFHRNNENIESKNRNMLVAKLSKCVFVADNNSTTYNYVLII